MATQSSLIDPACSQPTASARKCEHTDSSRILRGALLLAVLTFMVAGVIAAVICLYVAPIGDLVPQGPAETN